MKVDMHAHVLPATFPEAGYRADADQWPRMEPADTEDARLLVSGSMRFTARDVWYNAERRLSAMDENGLDAEVLSPFPALLNYRLSPETGRDLSRWVNDCIAQFRASDRTRFYGLGMVPLQDPDMAAEELSRIKELGLNGVEIASNVNGDSLAGERFLGFFQEAERLQVPVFIHSLPSRGGQLPGPAMGTFGVGTDIAFAAASIISSDIPDKCPDLRLAFSHGGGGFPLMLPRAQYFWGGTWNEEPPIEAQAGQPDRPEHSPMEYARRYYYGALVFDWRALRYLIDVIGPSRLLLGTDFPAMPREQPADRTLSSMDFPAEVKEDIAGNNCLRFLEAQPPLEAARPWDDCQGRRGDREEGLTSFLDNG